jgi:hypothetical protein
VFNQQRRVCAGTGLRDGEEKDGKVVKLKSLKPPMFDVRTGMEVLFSSADAQRSVWKSLKNYITKTQDIAPGGGVEVTCLYKHITTMPFADLNEIEEFEFPLAEAKGEGHLGVGGRENCVYPFITKVAKGELDRPTFSVRAPPKSVAHVRIGHRAPQSACAEGPPSACADRPLSACADRPPSATERHRAPPSACADRPPSTCAAEHFSRPQGGFGGSPPDIPLACPLPPQKDTPFLRSLSEPVPAEKGPRLFCAC